MSTKSATAEYSQFRVTAIENQTASTLMLKYRYDDGTEAGGLASQVFEAENSQIQILMSEDENGEMQPVASLPIPTDGLTFYAIDIFEFVQEQSTGEGPGFEFLQRIQLSQRPGGPQMDSFLTNFLVIDANFLTEPGELTATGGPPDNSSLMLTLQRQPGGGLVIGELVMDPEPGFTLHTVTLDVRSLPESAGEIKIHVEDREACSVNGPEACVISSPPLPLGTIEDLKAEKGFFPVRMDIIADTFHTRLNCYLTLKEGHTKASLNPILEFRYYVDDPEKSVKVTEFQYQGLNFGWMEAKLSYNAEGKFTIDGVTLEPVDAKYRFPNEFLPKPGYEVRGSIHSVVGRILDQNGNPRVGLNVRMMDHDRITKDDYLGSDLTNRLGFFEIQWDDRTMHQELKHFDKIPDPYFLVYEGRNQIFSTKKNPIRNPEDNPEDFILTI